MFPLERISGSLVDLIGLVKISCNIIRAHPACQPVTGPGLVWCGHTKPGCEGRTAYQEGRERSKSSINIILDDSQLTAANCQLDEKERERVSWVNNESHKFIIKEILQRHRTSVCSVSECEMSWHQTWTNIKEVKWNIGKHPLCTININFLCILEN